ncbi:Mss4-like protein [Mycena sanguinolenta]|nr:Mss4-like protein [Mycena sanguinolenta]
MPVELKGSCHCGAVRFSLQSSTAVPYQLCLCSICRKVGCAGGSINLGGHFKTLKVETGQEHISIYKAVLNRDTPEERIASSERSFCAKCSAMLWLYDKTWPELVHPFASAIDSPALEVPEKMVCLMTDSKPDYVRLPEGAKELYPEYPQFSLEDWHKKNGLFVE